jgi:8-oxo-dGTP diphosphatase
MFGGKPAGRAIILGVKTSATNYSMNAPKPFSLTVKAVMFDDQNRCLLIRRSAANHHFVGLWEWPGGKLDPGEDFATGLRREVREEGGLEIELTHLAGATQFEMPAANVILLCLNARPLSTAVRLSAEHDQFAWVPLAELPQWPVIEPMKPILQNFFHTRSISENLARAGLAAYRR